MDDSSPPDDSAPPSGDDAPVAPTPAGPPSARDRRPPEPPRPVRSGPPGRPPGGKGADRGRRGPPPAPARQGLEGAPRDPLRPVELPSRTLEGPGETWVVREAGRASSGVGMAVRAPLLHLTFTPGSDPEAPLKEVLTPGTGLADLSDHELLDLLARARPYQDRHDRQEVFPDTRKKGGRGM